MNRISPQELQGLHEAGRCGRLIDVRTPAEFRELHVPFAENVPLESFDPAAVRESCNGNGSASIYVICQQGGRGEKACDKLLAAGLPQVVNVAGGTAAWAAAGLPVVRGKRAISLERQVRIVAGTLVLIGAVLGFFVHPYFIGLSAFVGAGLAFAGITDTCGMGMLLARMPWNQVAGGETSEASASGTTACCSG